jgi:hypothetical protein
VTSTVAARIETGIDMERVDFDFTVAVLVALLVSFGRLVSVVFGTLKVCVREYYEFRRWLVAERRHSRMTKDE